MPSIPQAVAQAYRDLIHSLRALRSLAAVAMLMALGIGVAEALLVPIGHPTRDVLLRFLSGLALAFLITPYSIAVHRLIILGEIAPRYTFDPASARFQQFFWWWAAFSVAGNLPMLLLALVPETRAMSFFDFIALLSMLAITIAITIGTLRLTIIFPAVAVDAPGAQWENAVADTKGHAWQMLAVGVLAALPFLILLVVMIVLIAIGAMAGVWIASLISMILGSAISIAAITLFVAIASRFYLWIGNRVKTG